MEITVAKIRELTGLYGVETTDLDDALIQFNIDKVSQHIINETNQPSVPMGAYEVAIDMIIGSFLQLKYAMGQLDIDGLEINTSTISKIKDGDTDVTFATGDSGSSSPQSRFNDWLQGLNHPEYDWSIWRRLRW